MYWIYFKRLEKLTAISPIHIYINWNNNRLVSKTKDWNKLVLQTPETMKPFGSTKKSIDKTKHWEIIAMLEVIQVILLQWNLVDYQYQQKPKTLCTVPPNQYYSFFSNVEPSNFVFLKIYNAQFGEMVITFTDQSSRPLEIKDKEMLKK